MLKPALVYARDRLPANWAYEVLYQAARRFGVRSIEIEGVNGRMFASVRDQIITRRYLKDRIWAPETVKLFRGFFKKHGGGTFYDIGANIGLVTIPIAQHPKVSVIAFEPSAENCDLLRANVGMNCLYNNVRVINAAVAKENGTSGFEREAWNSGDRFLSPNGHEMVETVRLNDFPPPPGPFAVKIDTQGAEPAIIEGGAKVLSKADLVVLEYWPHGMQRMGLTPEPVLDWVRHSGFTHGALISEHDKIIGEYPNVENLLVALKDVTQGIDWADLVLRK